MVPDYESLMLPVLDALREGRPHPVAEVRTTVAAQLGLKDDDLTERLPSGSPVFNSRVHWAITYMAQAGLVRRPSRGVVQITDRGREVLAQNPGRVDNALLSRYPEFLDFKTRAGARQRSAAVAPLAASHGRAPREATPREQLASAVDEANIAVATELLERIRERDPAFWSSWFFGSSPPWATAAEPEQRNILAAPVIKVSTESSVKMHWAWTAFTYKPNGTDPNTLSAGQRFRRLLGPYTELRLIEASLSPRVGSRWMLVTMRNECRPVWFSLTAGSSLSSWCSTTLESRMRRTSPSSV